MMTLLQQDILPIYWKKVLPFSLLAPPSVLSLTVILVAEKKNVFKTSIGNLPPKDEVVITIVYVIELAFTEDKKVN